MAYETFEKVEGIIQRIDRGDDCCSMTVSLISDSNIVNVVVSGDTTVVDNVRLRPGMRIAAFYDTNLPVPGEKIEQQINYAHENDDSACRQHQILIYDIPVDLPGQFY